MASTSRAGPPEAPASMHMVFRVGRTQYAVESRRLRALVLAEIPAGRSIDQPHLRGTIVVARRSVPVVDVGSAFGLRRETPPGAAVLVVEASRRSAGLAGLLVDEVLDVISIGAEHLRSPGASETDTPYVKGIARTNERVVSLLDLERLLALVP